MKKYCQSLSKHAKHVKIAKRCNDKTETLQTVPGRSIWTPVPNYHVNYGIGFVASASALTLNTTSAARGLSPAVSDCQRRCIVTKPRSRTYYYDVLGVSPKATHAEIKSAYYKMSKVYHPDTSTRAGSQAKFSEISEAYETLRNVRKRRMYDQGIFSRNEPSADGGDYTQPFRQREGFGSERQAPPAGWTSQYNFDEFYRQHYADFIRKEKNDREYMKTMQQQIEHERMERKLRGVVTTFTVLSLCLIFAYTKIFNVSGQSSKQSNVKDKNN